MDERRISEYLHSLEPDGCEFMESLRAFAKENDVPIVRRETESFLRTMCVLKKPETILEIGTAIAYSTTVFAEYCDCVVTLENYEKRITLAKENIRALGNEDRIALKCGDAEESLEELSAEGRKFDMIFLDAAKGQYLTWLPDIKKLMEEGSVLIADNVLQDNTVMESRYTVARRDRTTHERMREFLYQIKHDPSLQTSILPVGDGVSVSVMRKTALQNR